MRQVAGLVRHARTIRDVEAQVEVAVANQDQAGESMTAVKTSSTYRKALKLVGLGGDANMRKALEALEQGAYSGTT